MTNIHSILTVVVASLATMLTRFLPFLLFRQGRKTPAVITKLGKVLPCAIMGMLVVYCVKDVQWVCAPYGTPELLGCFAVGLLQIWKRNTLLSIGLGTILYMALIRFIF